MWLAPSCGVGLWAQCAGLVPGARELCRSAVTVREGGPTAMLSVLSGARAQGEGRALTDRRRMVAMSCLAVPQTKERAGGKSCFQANGCGAEGLHGDLEGSVP